MDAVVASDGTVLQLSVVPGGGPPVVLLHGLACTRAMWDDVVAVLVRRGHGVIAFDLRGHGASVPVRGGGYGLAQQADDVRSVLEGLDLRDAVLVGHSAGGYAALAFAGLHPDVASARLRRVVTVGTAGTLTAWRERAVLRFAASRVFAMVLAWPRLGRAVVRRGAFGRGAHPEWVESTRRMALACPPPTKQAWVRVIRGTAVQDGLASTLTIPLTASTGSLDPTVTPARAAKLAEACGPLGEVAILDGAGHMAPMEQPEAVADLVR